VSKGSMRQRSPGSWEVKFDIGTDPKTGARRQRTMTVRGKESDAIKALRAKLTALDNEEYVDPSKMTVGQWVTECIDDWRALGEIGPVADANYWTICKNHIEPHLGQKRVQQLTTRDVKRWHGTLLTEGHRRTGGGISAKTAQMAHGVLVKALREAIKEVLLKTNVGSVQGRPKATAKPEIQILKADQIDPLLDGLKNHQLYRPAVVALHMGLRSAEQLALRWSRIEIDKGLMHIVEALEWTKQHGLRIKETKTENGRRTISMPQIVVETLRDHRRAQLETRLALGLGKMPDDGIVFPDSDGGYQKPNNHSSNWYYTLRRRGLRPLVKWHALRHTHASMLIDADVNVVKISKRLGHGKPDVTLRVYAHLFRDDDSDVAGVIDRILARQ
jgi:integrase